MATALPADALAFLADLRANNSKAWFDANRARYKASLMEPAKALVQGVGAVLPELDPDVQCVPKVNGSIFRINRDIRFSKDKTPYKDHLDLWFWVGERKHPASAFFARITPDDVLVGVGQPGFTKEQLPRFRAAVAADGGLAAITADLEANGLEVQGAHYKRVPAGFDASGPSARFLQHNGLYVDASAPAEVATNDLVGTLMAHWSQALPLHEWLASALG